MNIPEYECDRCYAQTTPLLVMREYKGKNSGNFYMRAECPYCHKLFEIVPQNTDWMNLYNKQKAQ